MRREAEKGKDEKRREEKKEKRKGEEKRIVLQCCKGCKTLSLFFPQSLLPLSCSPQVPFSFLFLFFLPLLFSPTSLFAFSFLSSLSFVCKAKEKRREEKKKGKDEGREEGKGKKKERKEKKKGKREKKRKKASHIGTFHKRERKTFPFLSSAPHKNTPYSYS